MLDEVWRKVRIGVSQSSEALAAELRGSGIRISNSAAEILGKMRMASSPRECTLVKLFVSQLHLGRRATTHAIHAQAAELGLSLVCPEVGPELRRAYRNQPEGESLLLAMSPVYCSGYPFIFLLTRVGGVLGLETDYGYLGHIWDDDTCWTFATERM